MNKKFYIIILLVFTFACNTSVEDSITPEIEVPSSQQNSLVRGGFTELDVPPLDADALYRIRFVNQMEWVAYMLARAVLTDEPSKADFRSFISDHNSDRSPGRIKLGALFASGDYPRLNDKFEELYHFYQDGSEVDICDRFGIGGGPTPIHGTGGNCGGCPIPQATYEGYVSFISEQHCLEIYLPNGFDAIIEEITTSAHPLSNDGYNDSYRHTPYCVMDASLTPVNVDTILNPLVVRPYRDPSTCTYDQYSDINFLEFLNVN